MRIKRLAYVCLSENSHFYFLKHTLSLVFRYSLILKIPKELTVFIQHIFIMKTLVTAIALISCLSAFSYAQQMRPIVPERPVVAPTPTVIPPLLNRPLPVAEGNNFYCAGYIQQAPMLTDFEIVGATDEPEKKNFTERNEIYLSRGTNHGVIMGDRFAVVRPRGQFKTKLTDKKGRLGYYVQEVGLLEIIRVKEEVSVARIIKSCDNILFGDIVQRISRRESPLFQDRRAIDIYAEPSGKAIGKIVLARDSRSTVATNQIVYIDLGAEDNVQIGNYLTIFRPLGTGGIRNHNEEETMKATELGYSGNTRTYGEYSSQAPRVEGSQAEVDIRTSVEAKRNRPANLRKIVGEMVIVNVKERTATALITRNVQEIQTGDFVELQ